MWRLFLNPVGLTFLVGLLLTVAMLSTFGISKVVNMMSGKHKTITEEFLKRGAKAAADELNK